VPYSVAYLAVVNVYNEEIGVSVIDSAGNVLYAQSFPSAFKQNLHNVPMVGIFHFRSGASAISLCKFTLFPANLQKNL